MKHKLIVIMLLALLPGLGHALGLGKIQAQSGLNEPFEARVELISATPDELDGLKIGLADLEVFQRAGIERSYVLTQLKFGIKETESGPDYIRIYSRESIREPFLNFLIEVSWSKGRIFREYTVLLDPPIYSPVQKRQQTIHPKAPTLDSIDDDHVVVYGRLFEEEVQPSAPVISSTPTRPIDYSGGDYGPTVTGDTLWSLARAMRPDNSISIQQMMFALLRANPDVFINGNINGLKRGEILRMPDLSDIQSLSKNEAFEQTKIQNNLWDEVRYPIAETVPTRPEVAAEEPVAVEPIQEPVEAPVSEPTIDVEVVEPVEEGEPKLRLLAPDEGQAGDQITTDAAMGDADSEALAGELALANESIEAFKLENAELGDKLSEAEGLITDLQRYIELKENELNLLQEQILIAAVEAEEAEEMEEVMEDEVEEEAMDEEEAIAEEEILDEEVEEAEQEVSAAETEAAASIVDDLLGQVMGVVELLKNNVMLVAGAIAGLLLIVFGALFAMRRRSRAEVVDIPAADDFPDFEDVTADTGSEDETDIGPALADAEAVTDLPKSEAEPDFDMGEAGDDKTQIVAPGAAEAVEEEEEDPMAEVNVFLAYEHFDQAEDFVRQAIEKEPDNIEFQGKLLEVFYAAGNMKSYEEAARVLHDKVDGQGDHWEMAVAMWQELSPSRELFAEPTGDEAVEEQTVGSSSGGIVDITDITGVEDQASDSDGEVLDVTAAMNLDEVSIEEQVDDGGLDLIPDSEAEALGGGLGDSEEEVLDIASSDEVATDEDILDVTAAVGLDEEPEEEVVSDSEDAALDFSFGDEAVDDSGTAEDLTASSESSDDILDLTADAADTAADDTGAMDDPLGLSDASDDVLDLTADAGTEAADDPLSLSDSSDDVLDLTADAEESSQEDELDEDILDVSQSSADDLLDVTTSTDFEPEAVEEDLLDVTAASSSDGVAVGDALLDSDDADASDTGLELDAGTAESDALETSGDDLLDLTTGSEEESVADDLTFDAGLDVSSPATGEIPTDGLDLDLQVDSEAGGETDAGDLDLNTTVEIPKSALQGIDMEETPATENAEPEVDMDSTVQAPSLSLSLEDVDLDDDDSDEGDHTVLVKRSTDADEQSAEDEIGTQLDLAKAYIELGDNDNAKTILDEVIAQGNDEQKQQAQDLLSQI